ncbi:MAG: hypothetical protein HY047_14480 [Acidobacteria bacterium]|nr:hypothetical protein [Acidobacteriota bacterium]
MVDALNRTRRWLQPDGCLIDLHPADAPARVDVCTAAGDVRVGEVQDDSDAKGPLGRHHAADLALAEVVAKHAWIFEQRATFTFTSDADSPAEIDEHLRRKWRAARLDANTRDRASALLRANPGSTVRVIEHVIITRMKPQKGN